MRILLVEDEPIIALDAEMSLISAGHEVVGPCRTSEAALEAAQREKPDIAMVDINLCGGNEGVSIVRALRERLGIRSVFATGQPNIAREHRDTALGVLQKPYSPRDLVDTFPVLEALMRGDAPPPPEIPAGLELFR